MNEHRTTEPRVTGGLGTWKYFELMDQNKNSHQSQFINIACALQPLKEPRSQSALNSLLFLKTDVTQTKRKTRREEKQ